jgi:gamma-glutamylputrescine oxidase
VKPPSPTYFDATSEPFSARPRLVHDIDTDVCVIGGGFAGLWLARMLLRRRFDVVVVERERVAHGASGRNAGLISAGFALPLDRLKARTGLDDARALYRLSREGVERVREELTAGLPGVNAVPGRLHVSRIDAEDALRRQAERLARDFDHDIVFWPTERVRATLASEQYFQALHDADAFHVHPRNLAIAIATGFELAQGRIYENTPALEIDADGVRKTVTTPQGKIRARHVVFGGSCLPAEAWPALAGATLTIASHIAVTRPLGGRLLETIRYNGGISDLRASGDYYRIIGDRLLWGAGLTACATERAGLAAFIARRIAGVYPALADAEIESAWTASMQTAVHAMPQIGQLRPGIWIASAFGPHGLNTAAMAAELITAAIAENDDRWRLFIPFGLVWTGGRLGRQAVRAALGSFRLKDRLREFASRRAGKPLRPPTERGKPR